MVDVSLTTALRVHPVSARDIYARWGSEKKPTPQSPITLQIPKAGTVQSDVGTLPWIDTAFAQALSTERFIKAIQAGSLPLPLDSSCEHAIDTRLFHTSAYRLAEKSVTLIEALGLTTRLTTLALNSTSLECPRCASICERYPTPQHALATLQTKLSGVALVFAEGPAETLHHWARALGISTTPEELQEHGQATPRARVQIDSLDVSQETTARLSGAAHSLWRLQNPALIGAQPHQTIKLYKHGHCAACGYLFTQERSADISRVFRSSTNETATTEANGSHILPNGLSIRASLCGPLSGLIPIVGSLNSHALTLALKTPLREKVAGTMTCRLSAAELATLSVCRSLGDALAARGVSVIDLPNIFISDNSPTRLSAIISEVSSQIGVVTLSSKNDSGGESFLTPRGGGSEELIGTLRIEHSGTGADTYAIRQGCDMTISGVAFKEIDAALHASYTAKTSISFTPTSKSEVFSLPVFSSASRSTSLLLHKLGLAESLARLFASSVDARSAGLQPKDFILSAHKRSHRTVCDRCDGLGLSLSYVDELPRPLAQECKVCGGARFIDKLGSISWRGLSLSTLLNTPLEGSLALLRALPRASELVTLLETLKLTHLPLGMPVALMSKSERHALLWIEALLSASPSKPAITLVEAPITILTPEQVRGLQHLLENASSARHLTVITIR